LQVSAPTYLGASGKGAPEGGAGAAGEADD